MKDFGDIAKDIYDNTSMLETSTAVYMEYIFYLYICVI